MSRPQRVLVIDDTEMVRKHVESCLRELDVIVTTAEDGSSGLSTARGQQQDLILLNVGLPDMSGFEVCHQLGEDPMTREVPIIFLTTFDKPDDKVRAFEMGAVDYVTKPFHPGVFLARVKLALKTRALVDMLETQARTDALTGLPNRALLTRRLEQAVERARKHPDYKFALLFLDFDHFKIINDSLGHEVGDLLLVSISRRLQSNLRGTDAVMRFGAGHLPARLGGDEFVILLDGIDDVRFATVVAERLQNVLSAPHVIGTHEVTSTASIGIVNSDGRYERADDVLRDADTAMYHAKNSGRARHVVFDDRMHTQAMDRLNMEKDLRRAMENNEFWLAYQPIVSLTSGRTTGFEALLRWTHPDGRRIPPDEFIGLAEEIGLIVPIGRWVILQAARQLRTWHDRFPGQRPLTMNVNLSKRQLSGAGLAETIQEALQETGLEPGSLKLELTESVIMDNPQRLTPLLHNLKRLGVELCMDDFGTGHSSLSCLHRFPIDVLKIDRTFVINTDENREYAAVIHAIITLAHTLKMTVVGEGVETSGQLAQLQALECDAAQGNFFSESVTAEEAEEFMRGTHGLAKAG